MNFHAYHWVWYLLGMMCTPKLTIAIALSLHGQALHLPTVVMVFVWIVAITDAISVKVKK
jgi:hypothetical protein